MKPMTAREFDKLSRRDFDNGATTDEIHAALKHRENLLQALEPALDERVLETYGEPREDQFVRIVMTRADYEALKVAAGHGVPSA